MNKFLALIIVIAISPAIGAVYGILHDQITYTVCEEYFTKYKFVQIQLVDEWNMGKNIGSEEAPEIKADYPKLPD